MVYLIRRFAAFYLDGILIMILVYVLYSLSELGVGNDGGEIEHPSGLQTLFLQVIVIFFYYSFWEFFWGRTIGKMILKFKIIGYYEKIGLTRFIQVTKRTLIRLIPLDPFSIFFNEEFKTWHDIISKTKVVDIRKASSHV